MSYYGLIKANSLAQRSDTMCDLNRINTWLFSKGIKAISVYGPSVRALENSVALGLERLETTSGMPKLERSEDFYKSILPEITDKEKKKFNKVNLTTLPAGS